MFDGTCFYNVSTFGCEWIEDNEGVVIERVFHEELNEGPHLVFEGLFVRMEVIPVEAVHWNGCFTNSILCQLGFASSGETVIVCFRDDLGAAVYLAPDHGGVDEVGTMDNGWRLWTKELFPKSR